MRTSAGGFLTLLLHNLFLLYISLKGGFLEGLNKYETTRLIGARALQLSLGAPPLIEVDGTESAIKIATREFETGIIPLVVVR